MWSVAHHSDSSDVKRSALEKLARAFLQILLAERLEEWSEASVNLIFVHYVTGLVLASCQELPAQRQYDLIRRLSEQELGPAAARLALHTPPPDGRGALASAIDAAEQAGDYDGMEFIRSNFID